MSNQELSGSWLSHADDNQDNEKVNTDVKVCASAFNLMGHLARKHTLCNLLLVTEGNEF